MRYTFFSDRNKTSIETENFKKLLKRNVQIINQILINGLVWAKLKLYGVSLDCHKWKKNHVEFLK